MTPDQTAAWQTLANKTHNTISQLFIDEPDRSADLRFRAADLCIDFSRQSYSTHELSLLIKLAEQLQLTSAVSSLLNGTHVNFTEQRPALHTALRAPESIPTLTETIKQSQEQIRSITHQLHNGDKKGFSGKAITNVVNLGIGGSDLGPNMVCEALKPYKNPKISTYFISNIDASDIDSTLTSLNPETTLFIISSKSWTTQETLSNAEKARAWMENATQSSALISQHFLAVTAYPDRAQAFGVEPNNIFPMWNWVGGRFSLWSAVGLSISLATSHEHFKALLAGASEMDTHFANAPLKQNLPVLLALTETWNVNFCHHHSIAIAPYSHDLRLLPEHLQQLEMESNGKSTNRKGLPINYPTSPILWGSTGTIGQHSFHQLLHQGTQVVPVDFILPLRNHYGKEEDHAHMIANCLAQAQALMEGIPEKFIYKQLLNQNYSEQEAKALAVHKSIPGNRPSTIISFESLTPKTLGALIALYEHKVFCNSVIWDINAFDQWGVELGKTIAKDIYQQLTNQAGDATNPATSASITEYRNIIK